MYTNIFKELLDEDADDGSVLETRSVATLCRSMTTPCVARRRDRAEARATYSEVACASKGGEPGKDRAHGGHPKSSRVSDIEGRERDKGNTHGIKKNEQYGS